MGTRGILSLFPLIISLLAIFVLLGTALPVMKENTGDLQLLWYDVEGSNWKALKRSVTAHGPIDQSGIRREALTQWKVQWHWPTLTDGSPDYAQATARMTITLYLPRWNGWQSADDALRTRWGVYLRNTITHEMHHVQNARTHFSALQRTLRSAPTMSSPKAHTGQARLERLITTWQSEDRRIDRLTAHGCLEGACL